MELRSRFLMGFRFRFPTRCRDCGKRKRKFGRPQPDRALRRVQQPSRSSARRARHARREEAAARGSARLRASLDRRCTRRSVTVQAGTEKRRSNRTEKHDVRRRQVGTEEWSLRSNTKQRQTPLIFQDFSGTSIIVGWRSCSGNICANICGPSF
jgi:hypothetical protein